MARPMQTRVGQPLPKLSSNAKTAKSGEYDETNSANCATTVITPHRPRIADSLIAHRPCYPRVNRIEELSRGHYSPPNRITLCERK